MESLPLLTSVLQIHDLSRGSHLALIALISFRNKSNGKCCPGIKTLAGRLNAPYETVRRWLRELRRAGIVKTTRHRASNWYHIELPERAGDPPADRADLNGPDRAKMNGLDRSLLPGSGASILTEQTDWNRQNRTAAADAKLVAVGKPAAAAAPGFASLQQNQNPTPEALAHAEAIVAELMPMHPEPGNDPKAVAEAASILASKPEAVGSTLETMRQTHAASRAAWANYRHDRFIPQLWRWFRDGDWKYLRPDRKEVKRETVSERRDRESKEYDEKLYRRLAEAGSWERLRAYGGEEAVEVWREKIAQAG